MREYFHLKCGMLREIEREYVKILTSTQGTQGQHVGKFDDAESVLGTINNHE